MDKRDRALDLFQEAYEQQMNGDLERAISLYKKSLAVLPTAEAYTFLGWTYAFQKRFDDAIRECEKAIVADPEFG
ncbi:MAG TPA: tetratricopeptide repeat protein, partial [Verrucomicrobiae bacterium]|nr:tetratricopeptide repeat protein [Verrucomicrobiae bacterium]